jgi:hypothetical protein
VPDQKGCPYLDSVWDGYTHPGKLQGTTDLRTGLKEALCIPTFRAFGQSGKQWGQVPPYCLSYIGLYTP